MPPNGKFYVMCLFTTIKNILIFTKRTKGDQAFTGDKEEQDISQASIECQALDQGQTLAQGVTTAPQSRGKLDKGPFLDVSRIQLLLESRI